MSWKKITLAGHLVSQGHLAHILKQCPPILNESGNPDLPSPLMGATNVNTKITSIYFPPKIVPFWGKILLEYSSVFCDPPDEPVRPMMRRTSSKDFS